MTVECSLLCSMWMVSLRRVPPMDDPYLTPRRHTLSRQLVASGYPFEDVYGYSRAVRVGDQVFVSGTTARPPHLDSNAYAQCRFALTAGTRGPSSLGFARRRARLLPLERWRFA